MKKILVKIVTFFLRIWKNGKLSRTQTKTWKKAHERYQNLSEEEKDKRQKMVRDRYKNLPKEKKQKLREYMKKYYLAHKK